MGPAVRGRAELVAVRGDLTTPGAAMIGDPSVSHRDARPLGEPEDYEDVVERLLAATGMAQDRQAQLQRALDTRILIEQAKGMLAERLAVSVDDAFEILRGAARSNRLGVHDLAARVVSRDGSFDELVARAAGR